MHIGGRGNLLVAGQMDAVYRGAARCQRIQDGVPVAPFSGMHVRGRTHQADLGLGRDSTYRLPDSLGRREHGFAGHVQPDLAVGVGFAGPQHAG